MKKIISIGFTALMIVSVFVVLDIAPVGNVKAMGDPIWNGSFWETAGDWVVDGTSSTYTYTGTVIVVNGNLNIVSTYTLTLQNVTLIMNCPYNGAYNITVEAGGTLIIEDVVGAPSIITNNATGNFGFIVESGSNPGTLQMRNSKLLHCGWALNETDYRDGGLWITGDATIENNDISEGYVGVIIYQDDPANPPSVTISGNTIHDYPKASGIAVMEYQSMTNTLEIGPNNNVYDCYWGVYLGGSVNVRVHNNTLHNNGLGGPTGGGLGIQTIDTNPASDIEVDGNNITNNWENSVWAYSASNLYIHNNILNGSFRTNQTYFVMVNGLEIRKNYICQGGKSTSAYIRAEEITDLIFDNNIVSDNVGIGALFNFCNNITVMSNNFENNSGGGFGLQLGTYDGLIKHNIIKNNADMGLHIVGHNIEIRYNTFESNGDGSFPGGDPIWQDCAVDIMNSYDIYLHHNDFIDNVKTIGLEEVDGIYLFGSERINTVYMWNNTLDKNQYNLHCRGGVEAYDTNSSYIKNTNFVDSYDVYLERSMDAIDTNHVTFLNTTFDNSSVYIDTVDSGDFTCKWFKHILTLDSGSTPVSGVSVLVNDSNGDPEPSSGQPFITDVDGGVEYIPLTEYIQNSAGKTFYTPHTIEVEDISSTGYDEPRMWHSHVNIIELNVGPTVTDLYTELGPTGSVYRTNTIEIRAEGFDAEDPNTDLIPHFEYRVNEISLWINETSPYFGSWGYNSVDDYWYISFTPDENAILDFYGFRVRLEDTNGSYSDWYVVDDMVQVLNNLPNGEQIIVLASPPEVLRGQNIDIYADASDIEDIDEDANWDADLQYRLNGSASWATTYVTASYYDPGTGNWQFEFSPPGTRPNPNHGLADFQVRFQDTDGDWSGWYQELDLVDVLNNIPSLVSFSREGTSVYRGDTIRVYADVSDLEEMEGDLYVHFYYTYDGLNWVDDWLSTPQYGSGGRGQYNVTDFFVEFSPPPSADLGIYEFRVYISDSDGGYITEIPGGNTINVRNNLPIPIDIKPSAPTVRAGTGFIYLHVNASDLEDDENLLTVTVQWQYNETTPSGVWDGAYITAESYDPKGWLRVRFTPPNTMDLGHYDFRAKITDQDGGASNNPEWVYTFRSVEVIGEGPSLINIKLGDTEVYRGDTLYIFLNATDSSDHEPELTPEIQFKAPSGDWTDIPNSSMYYEDTNSNLNDDIGYWVINFTTEIYYEIGYYQFRGRVKNTSEGYSNGGLYDSTIPSDAPVKNNLPIPIDIFPSAQEVRATGTEYIYLYVNASDLEDAENLLGITLQWQYNETGPSGMWSSSYISIDTYYGIPDSGWLRLRFTPPPIADLGHYDFRAKVTDQDGGSSINPEWIYIYRTIEVFGVEPFLEDIKLGDTEVFRGQTLYIFLNATDLLDLESELIPEIQYKSPTGDWMDISSSSMFYDDINGNLSDSIGFWVIYFIPINSDEIGIYQFRGRVKNSAGGYSNGGVWTSSVPSTAEVKNNLPQATDLRAGTSSVNRGDSIYIYADATDFEDAEEDLTPNFEYMAEGGDWDDEYLLVSSLRYTGGSWRITFSPPADSNFPTGLYDLRVWFEDSDGDTSNIITMVDLVDVKNAEPMVDDLNVPAHGYRLKAFHITANGTDDHGEAGLTPSFEYKSPSGDWTAYGDIGSYFQSVPQFVDGYWRITFYPPADAELGQYSFRVSFSDGIDTSPWTFSLNSFMILNNLPEVQIDSPSPGDQPSQTVSFSAMASDAEDATLSYNWNFGDGNTSNNISPTHTYERPGTYTIIVTVTDDDADIDQDTITITILEVPVNEVPTVNDLTVPSSGYRLQTIYISANGSDIDGSEIALIPTFEYKGPQGDWIKEDDTGTYFTGSPQYISGEGYWRIEFLAPKNASLGLYSFRVRFSDEYNTSEWMTKVDSFSLMNNNPEVEITDPSSGEQPSDKVTFTASASDTEDAELSYIWNFGDEETSEEISPTHKYKKPGTYTVTLTVTDDDDATATDTITIEIKEEEVVSEIDPMIMALSLLPLIIAILILLWLFALKKRKKEEKQPAIPEEAEEEIPKESEEELFESEEEFDSETTDKPEEESYDSKEDLESESSEEFDEEEEIT